MEFAEENLPIQSSEKEITVRLSGLRRAVAENVVSSHLLAPHVTLTMEIDVTEMARFREGHIHTKKRFS
jgi:pyruvate/2-oxoglutarate dehydrogenase complex dihydrolipoamide acyltransferase (E2) component